jgi:hypothetical protein
VLRVSSSLPRSVLQASSMPPRSAPPVSSTHCCWGLRADEHLFAQVEGDVALKSLCCKPMFRMFLGVLSACCRCRIARRCCFESLCCKPMFSIVLRVLRACCRCFRRMLQVLCLWMLQQWYYTCYTIIWACFSCTSPMLQQRY